ncbi:hypothetical protein KI387_018380, partial [Taxus chinensis]
TNTVRVSNVSVRATKRDIQDFFSFSGDIDHIQMQSDGDFSQLAFVTFKDPQALDTALLLSGATIIDQSVNISPVEHYLPHAQAEDNQPPPYMPKEGTPVTAGVSAVNKAEDVVTSMLAKGFVLGKDAIGKAKAFDEKHGLTANASAKVTSFDKKIGLTEKISAGTAAVNEKVRSVDQKFQVSEKTKSAFAAAEQKVNNAGSALMKNKYVFTGASWVTGAFSRVTKAAEDVGMKTKEKVQLVEGQKKDRNSTSSGDVSHDFAQVHLTEPGNAYEPLSSATHSGNYSSLPRYDSGSFSYPDSSMQASGKPTKPPPAQGLIL